MIAGPTNLTEFIGPFLATHLHVVTAAPRTVGQVEPGWAADRGGLVHDSGAPAGTGNCWLVCAHR